MINTPDTIRETKRSPLDWFCANCVRDHATLNKHGRCPSCDSNQVTQSQAKETVCEL